MDILNDLFGRLLKFDTNCTKLWGIFTLLCYKSWGKLGEGDQLWETSIFEINLVYMGKWMFHIFMLVYLTESKYK